MRRKSKLASALLFASAASGCYHPRPYECHLPFGHPTMTPDEIAIGNEARVHELSEASSLRVGSSTGHE